MSDDPQRKSHGCLFWGAIISGVFLLMFLTVVLVGYLGFRYVRGVVDKYTDSKPIAVRASPLSDEEVKAVQVRIDDFQKAIKGGAPPSEPLTLTADEISAVIAKEVDPKLELRVYVAFEEERVKAQLSVPASKLGLPFVRGRYFNGSGEFAVYLHDGMLNVNVKSLAVNDKPLPEEVLRELRAKNFAEEWNRKPDVQNALSKLQEITMEDGKIIFVPKREPLETGGK